MDGAVLELLRALVVGLASAGAVYGGIRADLKHAIKTGETAHTRIDQLMMKGKSHG